MWTTKAVYGYWEYIWFRDSLFCIRHISFLYPIVCVMCVGTFKWLPLHLWCSFRYYGQDVRDIFVVKLTFEILNVRGQQRSFSTHERMFLWKCRSFKDRKCLDLKRTRILNLRIHAECSNRLNYRGRTNGYTHTKLPQCNWNKNGGMISSN